VRISTNGPTRGYVPYVFDTTVVTEKFPCAAITP
jgi:hypothetical protein